MMRGGGQLHSINIVGSDGRGYTHYSAKRWDYPFITFAASWAEARLKWPLDDLDAVDADDTPFSDYVNEALYADVDGDDELFKYLVRQDEAMAAEIAEASRMTVAQLQERREMTWWRELEREWHTIQVLARQLQAIGADMYHSASHKTWQETINDMLYARAQ
ncbi:hypothetical protein [Mycobacterium paraterrae]|uniref:Uncharacterized protein n=1 Tax=Mycobacterium paraterrae TaxID=577492 RepID=A0ABY3VUN3_9MYCO|nr:hypothetical protein [Mycobacterium paraterrae]UMB71769.1 hypothetical protein MKK62_11395 [Mycobacterium paraterrae]